MEGKLEYVVVYTVSCKAIDFLIKAAYWADNMKYTYVLLLKQNKVYCMCVMYLFTFFFCVSVCVCVFRSSAESAGINWTSSKNSPDQVLFYLQQIGTLHSVIRGTCGAVRRCHCDYRLNKSPVCSWSSSSFSPCPPPLKILYCFY